MMVGLKPIMPKELNFSPAKIEKAINKVLDDTAQKVRADYELTTKTWNHKPVFQIDVSSFKRVIHTNSDVYKGLDVGTKVRFAIMTPGFVSKTIPGQLTSRAGKGGVLTFTKRPMRGIQARGWSELIQDKWAAELPKLIQKAINDAVTGK